MLGMPEFSVDMGTEIVLPPPPPLNESNEGVIHKLNVYWMSILWYFNTDSPTFDMVCIMQYVLLAVGSVVIHLFN